MAEGRITARFNHPNIVTVHDVGQHHGIYYLAAELLPGGTLRERLPGLTNLVDKLRVLRGIARGLGYAHEHKIVHRDVKPVNIMFRDEAQPVVTDFGIAKSLDASHVFTQAGGVIGTPQYMSPEQAQGLELDGRSDLYALGIMMYEMLIGHVPFDAPDPLPILFMHVQQTPPDLPDEFTQLQPILDRLLAKLPEQRYQRSAEFSAALEPFLGKLKTGRVTVVPGSNVQVLADATLRIAEPAIKQNQPIAAAPITPPEVQPHYLSSQREEVLRLLSSPAPYAGRQRSNRLAIAIAASVFALAAGFGLNWLTATKEANQVQPALGLAQSAKDQPPELVYSSARQTVMAEVRELIAQGALITPEQDCALALVTRLLEQAPSDSGALSLLREIGTALSVQVQERWRAGNRADALSLLRTGLTRMPNDAELNRLRADFQAEIERSPVPQLAPEFINRVDVGALFKRAEVLYARSQISAPAGDNAVEVLYAVIKQQPNHTQAQAMLAKIASDYERVALVWQERGRVDQALAQVRNGLKAQPANERLRRLELDLLGP